LTHRTVVRNQACQPISFNVRERHNERKNEEYFNGDVELDRSHMNVHYRRCFREDGTPETYQETFDRLLAEGKIVKRGTKADAKLFCEMVFDINTTYFEENGGYEFAKKFYEEAYRLAIKEAGSEDYIISAVLHADERNSALSEKLGRDVYHYHLHVVYVPIVEKKVYFRKNNKDPNLAGKLKEVIPQISQNRKWPPRMTVEIDGKTVTRNSYSFLQDRYYQHMKAAGFDGFERGERGSTTEHLEVLDYKIQQDTKRLAELETAKTKKKAEVDYLVQATKVRADISAAQDEIDGMATPGKTGKNKIVSNADWERVATMAKRCALLDAKIKDMQKQIDALKRDRDKWKDNYNRLWAEVKDFIGAIRSIPNRLRAFIAEHLPGKSKSREAI
jgi:hypothetical protein